LLYKKAPTRPATPIKSPPVSSFLFAAFAVEEAEGEEEVLSATLTPSESPVAVASEEPPVPVVVAAELTGREMGFTVVEA
jgi:hypothetical protein